MTTLAKLLLLWSPLQSSVPILSDHLQTSNLTANLIMSCRFEVISHMNIFFTCKNTLVILLQLYRSIPTHWYPSGDVYSPLLKKNASSELEIKGLPRPIENAVI